MANQKHDFYCSWPLFSTNSVVLVTWFDSNTWWYWSHNSNRSAVITIFIKMCFSHTFLREQIIRQYDKTFIQILQVVNPNCSYSSGEKRNLKGVAISLKKFLKVLDENNIEHDDESQIRRNLRRRADVKTTATQFFLSPNATSREMIRKNCHDTTLLCHHTQVWCPIRIFRVNEWNGKWEQLHALIDKEYPIV